jgi:signal transduction histidine kinase
MNTRQIATLEGVMMFGARVRTMTAAGEGAAYLVHEVNQPLAAILINAETALRWLTRDPANLDEAIKAIERIVGNSHRAADVLKSVRNLVRQSPPVVATFDINDVIKDLLNLMGLDLRRDGIAVETELAENVEPVIGDRRQLERVVANLIANSIAAMSTVQDRQRKLRISTHLNNRGDVLVAVEDSGTGLDPAHVDRIFDPFFTTKPEGMGLGLSICRSIVEGYGGRLWATPNVPYGSIFRFIIPTIGHVPSRPARPS